MALNIQMAKNIPLLYMIVTGDGNFKQKSPFSPIAIIYKTKQLYVVFTSEVTQ